MQYTLQTAEELFRNKHEPIREQKMKVERLRLKVELTKTNDFLEKMYLRNMIECFDEYFETGKFDTCKFSENKIMYCKTKLTPGDFIRLHTYQFSVKKTFADKQKIYNKKNRTCNRELSYDILQYYDGGIVK